MKSGKILLILFCMLLTFICSSCAKSKSEATSKVTSDAASEPILKCFSCLYLEGDKTGLSSEKCRHNPPNRFLFPVSIKTERNLEKLLQSIVQGSFKSGLNGSRNASFPVFSVQGFKNATGRRKMELHGKNGKETNSSDTFTWSGNNILKTVPHCYNSSGVFLGREFVVRDVVWKVPSIIEDECNAGLERIITCTCRTKDGCNSVNAMGSNDLAIFSCLSLCAFIQILLFAYF